MKDFIGQELKVGDHVAYAYYGCAELTSGYIIGFSGKDFIEIISEFNFKVQSMTYKEGIMYQFDLKTEADYENWLNQYPSRREMMDGREDEPYPVYTFKKKNKSIAKIL